MSNRSKVGKGNRKIVRDHFRANGVEFEFGRDCINNRYSFKPDTGFNAGFQRPIVVAEYEAFEQKLKLDEIARTCPVPVEVSVSRSTGGWTNAPQFNTPVRFLDV